MIIKKFQAKTENEAVELAKKELGQNVVIMNVRNVKRKGLFAFFKPQLTEITVALEDEPEIKPQPPIIRPLNVDQSKLNETAKEGTDQALSAKPVSVNEVIKEETPDSAQHIAQKLDSLQELLAMQFKPEETKPEEEETKSEEASNLEEPEKQDEFLTFEKLLYSTMIDNEIQEVYARQIIDEMEKNRKPNMKFDHALAGIYQKMILKFGQNEIITASENKPKVVFFVGPTGVGKTTTIAKIASRFRVNENKKVALLTADTYRIAAAEQLHTYADILEVPFQVIYSPEEMLKAIEVYKEFDYVLVDTAGHSHKNEEQKNNMADFLHCVDDYASKEVYLVVSATTKYRDLVSICDTYSGITDYKLIFTKLDETTTVGNLLNLKLYTGAPLSYVTHGQNVPDDIEIFNAQKTVKLLLGGKKK